MADRRNNQSRPAHQTAAESARRASAPRSTRAARSGTRRPAVSGGSRQPARQVTRQSVRATNQVTRQTKRQSSKTARPSAKRPSVSRLAASSASQTLDQQLPEQELEQSEGQETELVSTSVGELRKQERAERLKKSSRRYLLRLVAVIGVIVVILAGWAVLYNSPAFSITNVRVNGVEHLTNEEMTQLANVPDDTTLLRVDVDTIASRVKQSSWVESVQINRVFPDTLEINVTERPILAIAEMPNDSGTAVKSWVIAQDRVWLMPIPDASSEAAQTTSAKIYEDAEKAVHIVDLPFGTQAEIGQVCSDTTVNNALDILQEMTTELSGKVIKVSAASVAETSLFLDNGVEIAFGAAEDIRDKERTILKIMEDNPDGVAYINVRMVENPTWRAI